MIDACLPACSVTPSVGAYVEKNPQPADSALFIRQPKTTKEKELGQKPLTPKGLSAFLCGSNHATTEVSTHAKHEHHREPFGRFTRTPRIQTRIGRSDVPHDWIRQ